MKQDRVALHGFGKMFKKLWHNQIENVEKLADYIVLRGGEIENLYINLNETKPENLHKMEYFTNENSAFKHIDYFLKLEKESFAKFNKLHKSTKKNALEVHCINNSEQKYLYNSSHIIDIDPVVR